MQLTMSKINWFALVSGALMLAVVGLSIFTPWWQLQIGSGSTGFAVINANPFYTNFGVLGLNFVIPILFAINIMTMALFVVSGIILVVYSVMPTKSYSKQLLCYGYKRPIYTLIGFIVTLVVIVYLIPFIINMIANGAVTLSVPLFALLGTSIIQLPTGMLNSGSNSLQIGVTVVAAFQYTFYLGVVATALAIVARIYHRKIIGSTPVTTSPVQTVTVNLPPAS